MHRVVKRTIEKKVLTARDLGILQIANLIDLYNGEGLTGEQMEEQFKKVSPYSSICSRDVYDKYMDVEFEIRAMREIYCEKMDKAQLACDGLIILYTMALHIENQTLKKNWLDLVKKSKRLAMGTRLWLALQENICACGAIQGGFVAAGQWLKIQKLEEALPSLKLSLKDSIQKLNQLASQVFSKLDDLKMIDRLPDILKKISLEDVSPTREDISIAKSALNFKDFDITFDKAIDKIFYDLQERINYKRIFSETK